MWTLVWTNSAVTASGAHRAEFFRTTIHRFQVRSSLITGNRNNRVLQGGR